MTDDYFAPCWSCRSEAACYTGCVCAKCLDPESYEQWRVEAPDEYDAWIERQRDPEAAMKKLKTVAHRLSWQFTDLLNHRDRLRGDIAQRPPRWWTDLEARGDIQPWTSRTLEWRRRLALVERRLAAHEARLTLLDRQLEEVLAIIADADAREAHEEAVLMRGHKREYARRLRPNLKPPSLPKQQAFLFGMP
jgi:hypothetical protein